MMEVRIRKEIQTYLGPRDLVVHHHFSSQSITRVSGPSGSGKTTLLRMIAGLLKADEGQVVVSGKTWQDSARQIFLRPQQRSVGFVFQDYALFPNMTVEEHLGFATRDAALVNRLLYLSRLEPFRTRRPHQLSGGQQQRLAIVRALALRPEVLLMDEPFSALDPKLRTALVGELRSWLAEFPAVCLIASHHEQDLLPVTDAVISLQTVTE
jgi:molybdate transport system ATP-binding protein